MFQFNYKISEQDYLEFNVYHAFNSPHGKRTVKYKILSWYSCERPKKVMDISH
jgi:hypothetical protein